MSSGQSTHADLESRRAAVRRGLARSNAAAVSIIAVVLVLAGLAVAAAFRSEQLAREATRANHQTRLQLGQAYVAQARAEAASAGLGHKLAGLSAVSNAAALGLSAELQRPALTLLTSFDLAPDAFWRLPAGVRAYVVDPSATRFVFGDRDGASEMRDLRSNSLIARFQGPPQPVTAHRFSRDGALLAIRYGNGSIRVWDIAAGTNTLELLSAESGITFGRDALLIITETSRNRVRLWDARQGRPVGEVAVNAPLQAGMHPWDNQIAIVSRGSTQVRVWDWDKERITGLRRHTNALTCVDWSSDGRWLVAGSERGEVVQWNLASDTAAVLPLHRAYVARVRFNTAGTLALSTSWDNTSTVWDVATGRVLARTSEGAATDFSLDGEWLAFVRPEEGLGLWRVLPDTLRQVVPVQGGRDTIFSTDAEPTGRFVAAAKSDGVHILDLERGLETHRLVQPELWGRRAVFSPDGRHLYSGGTEGLKVWKVERPLSAEEPQIRFSEPEVFPSRRGIHPLAAFVSPNVSNVAVSLNNGQVLVGRSDELGKYRVLTNHGEAPHASFSPDGRWLALGGRRVDGTALWDVGSASLVRWLTNGDSKVEFSRDGQWLVIGRERDVTFWSTSDWQPKAQVARAFASGHAGAIAVSPDSKTTAFKLSESEVALANTGTTNVFAVLPLGLPAGSGVNTLRFSPDGERLLMGVTPDELHVWNLRNLEQQLAALGISREPVASKPELPPVTPSRLVPLTAASGALLALGFGMFVFRRHRQLLREYEETEAIVAQRNRELEAAQRELFESQKMKALGTLAAGIAHDFNNLLSVVRMSNEMVEEASSPAEIRENTAEIEQAVQQGKAIVRSMLGYSRRRENEEPTCAPASVVRDLVTLLSKEFLSGVKLKLDLTETALGACSRSPLEQVLLNLVVNAAEAMKGGGELRLAVAETSELPSSLVLRPREARRYVSITVADTGPGIPADLLGRIFEPFFTTKVLGAQHGTGLGLSLVYSIAEREGLGIAVQSSPGQGADFRILIPLAPVPGTHSGETKRVFEQSLRA
jgi:signal transduction histidine kinase